ncbi:Excreted virulence factor EspC, type VII ESX diderm [Mycolicibacterium rutilum]|uniref:Excreted virulence factor EspC, type VII ESX diderm n=1 Tax=Mycolicibacterium rutilum TaxID=370526 RepID=A0A1H6JAM9_MYCRU|nr:ESX-1 secretion-associated protein [Mycolicibacterium rutilum]SEH56061.1 Excreted virulence factor EspC, type VII ESX diderm [Mycolicibacterium rutilum]
MSGEELRVTTAHLSELAVRHERAAHETRSATVATEGVDAAVKNTHGSIASATSSALDAVLSSRHSAGDRMANVSDTLRDKLTDAAKRYGSTDEAQGSALDSQVRPA